MIPAQYRKALGLRPGSEVRFVMQDGELRVLSPAQAVKRAQALVRRHLGRGQSLVDDLREARRRESQDG